MGDIDVLTKQLAGKLAESLDSTISKKQAKLRQEVTLLTASKISLERSKKDLTEETDNLFKERDQLHEEVSGLKAKIGKADGEIKKSQENSLKIIGKAESDSASQYSLLEAKEKEVTKLISKSASEREKAVSISEEAKKFCERAKANLNSQLDSLIGDLSKLLS